MKKMKKFMAVILVLSLLPVFSSYAEEYTEDYAEEVALTQTECFKKLQAFGIMTADDEILYYDNVSRAMFILYAMRCYFDCDIYGENFEAEIPFSDVSPQAAGAKEILIAKELGIIRGKTETEFYPDENITANEAAKIMITALGYGEIAESSGGYPAGYLAIANRLRIFNGCNVTPEGYIPVRAFLKMLMNTLEAEVMDIEAIQKKYNNVITKIYTRVKDRTLLEYVFGIYKEHGIVESNEYTSVNGLSEIGRNRVEINGEIYMVNKTEAAELLGYNTEFYYKLDDNETNQEIVYISPYNNNVVEVDSNYIESDGVTTTNFKYYKDSLKNKAYDVKISKSAVMIYNGGQKSISKASLCPNVGSVILIDNNRDNAYDVVRVMSYRTILVAGISPSTHTVSDVLGGAPVTIDPEDDDYDIFIEKNGAAADFSSISDRCVISYAESTGNIRNVKYVKVSTNAVEGVLEAIGDEVITISGVDYPLSKGMTQELYRGDTGTFYLDFTGRIVAKKLGKEIVYGYLNNIEKKRTIGICAQIFTENNRWVVLEFNKNFTYNNSKYTAEKFYDELTKMDDFRQLINYKVDEEGKITMIKTANSYEAYSKEEEEAIEQNVFRVYPTISSEQYRYSFKGLGNTVRIGDTTKIFVIPDQSEERASTEDFYILAPGSLISDVTYTNIIPYDLDRSRTASAVVMLNYERTINPKSAFMIVNKIVKSLNTDGTWVDSIKGYYKNSLLTLSAKDDSVYSELTEPLASGDIVQIEIDNDGNICSLISRYNLSDGTDQQFTVNNLYSSSTFVAGTVHYSDSEKKTLVADVSGQKIVIGTGTSTLISVYDTAKKTLTEGTLADLEKGNGFFARMSYYIADEIVVFH